MIKPIANVTNNLNTGTFILTFSAGAATYFADRDALKGSLGESLREVRPTVFFGVPRVFEKIAQKMQELGKSATPLQRSIGSWAKKTGLEHNLKKLESGDEAEYSRGHKLSYPVAKKFVFSKVKQKLGLDRCRWICGGGAPFSRETLEYYLSLDIKVYEMYGLSETCGPHTGNHPALHKFETVGPSITGCRTKIHEPDNGTGQGTYNYQMQYFLYFLLSEQTITDRWRL